MFDDLLCKAMFALKRYDDVVATVIESETQDISVEDDKKRTGFAKKALQIMMRPGSEVRCDGYTRVATQSARVCYRR